MPYAFSGSQDPVTLRFTGELLWPGILCLLEGTGSAVTHHLHGGGREDIRGSDHSVVGSGKERPHEGQAPERRGSHVEDL